MLFPQKSQYALRAVFELAKQYGRGPVKISDIAETQIIPVRFLEVILNELKQGGFVDSVRGKEGGYMLLLPPAQLAVGQILRFVQGPLRAVDCRGSRGECPLCGKCVFDGLWHKVDNALAGALDSTTFQELVDQEIAKLTGAGVEYAI